MKIQAEAFQALIAPLIGMPVSHAWLGFGSPIFLELGSLSRGKGNPCGEACISVSSSWRVESDQRVVFGSSETGTNLARSMPSLVGASIGAITISGAPMEICVQLGNGQRLRSMAAVAGDPQWDVRLPDRRFLHSRDGALHVDEGNLPGVTERDGLAMEHARATAARWSDTAPSPEDAQCRRCQWFVWLDGDFELHDFGVCTNARSARDGRVTEVSGGCVEFALRRADAE